MKKKELIDFLSNCPEDAEVYMCAVDRTIPINEEVKFDIEIANNKIVFYWMD